MIACVRHCGVTKAVAVSLTRGRWLLHSFATVFVLYQLMIVVNTIAHGWQDLHVFRSLIVPCICIYFVTQIYRGDHWIRKFAAFLCLLKAVVSLSILWRILTVLEDAANSIDRPGDLGPFAFLAPTGVGLIVFAFCWLIAAAVLGCSPSVRRYVEYRRRLGLRHST